MKSVSLVLVVTSLFLSGCAFKTSPYGASMKNVDSIKTSEIKPVAVSKFQSTKPGLSSIMCRGVGPVTVESSFENYIEKAFIDELKLAGAYNPNSSFILSGKLEEVDFSSGMTDGKWLFTLSLTNAKNESVTTQSSFPFSGSFIGDRACGEVAQVFSLSVQKLIADVVQNPKFKQVAN
jgi:hypothetical protein